MFFRNLSVCSRGEGVPCPGPGPDQEPDRVPPGSKSPLPSLFRPVQQTTNDDMLVFV